MAVERPLASVYELVAREFGVEVDVVDSRDATSVGTTDVIVARNDPRRVGLIVVNLSANVVYLRPLQPASTTTGIRLTSNGGTVLMNWRADMVMPALEWHGIADGAGSAIFVLEVLIGRGRV